MKKVLVVDDDPDILEAVQLILETSGYTSEAITKGDETYSKIAEYKPDMIILDVLLSGNDGRTICKNLKRTEETKQIPIIMMSAHPTARQSVNECGADAFLAKPFSISEMLEQLAQFEKNTS